MWARSDRKRDRGLTTPEDVARYEGLSYGPDPRWHTLEVYRPKAAAGALPVIVSIHGGGYFYGGTEQYQFYCMSLAQLGFAVVNFNYRLAPEHRFPAPLEDTNAVLAWAAENREKYGFDMDNCFLVGDSAGAQLASQYAAIWSSPAYEAVMDIHPPAVRIAGVGLNCGMYDLVRDLNAKGAPKALFTPYFTRDFSVWGEKLNVMAYIGETFPPAYLMSAPGDFLLSGCAPMAELLRSRGVTAEYRIYGDKNTGHVFHLNVRSPLARQANRDQTDFLRQFIRE